MGARGPRPEPTAIKQLKGNPGKRPLNTAEPQPDKTVPVCPAWMNKHAKAEWKRIVPELERLGLLTCIDGGALEGYCQAYGQWVEAEKSLKKNGMTFTTPNGYVQQRPEVAIAQKYLTLMKNYLSEFGLSPSSRSKLVTTPVPKNKNKLLHFLNSG